MSVFTDRHPLLAHTLPCPAHTPIGQAIRRSTASKPQNAEIISVTHASFADLMQSARQEGGKLMQDQLAALWPQASPHDLALAQGLGGALWLGDMLLRVREDAQAGHFLFPQDLMQRYLVDTAQLTEGRHDFALRRLSEHLAGQALKILQGSAPLGLSAPLALRYRLRWHMLYAGFILQAMQRDPKAPFIQPVLSFRDRMTMLKNTFFISASSSAKSGSCGTGGCST